MAETLPAMPPQTVRQINLFAPVVDIYPTRKNRADPVRPSPTQSAAGGVFPGPAPPTPPTEASAQLYEAIRCCFSAVAAADSQRCALSPAASDRDPVCRPICCKGQTSAAEKLRRGSVHRSRHCSANYPAGR